MQLRKYVDFISRSNRQISSVVHIPYTPSVAVTIGEVTPFAFMHISSCHEYGDTTIGEEDMQAQRLRAACCYILQLRL